MIRRNLPPRRLGQGIARAISGGGAAFAHNADHALKSMMVHPERTQISRAAIDSAARSGGEILQ
jgi:hypothetical protein